MHQYYASHSFSSSNRKSLSIYPSLPSPQSDGFPSSSRRQSFKRHKKSYSSASSNPRGSKPLFLPHGSVLSEHNWNGHHPPSGTSSIQKSPFHARRKAYGGDQVVVTTQEFALGRRETTNARVFQLHERIVKDNEPPEPAPVTVLESRITEQNDVLYENKLKSETLEILQNLRAQNSLFARELRHQETLYDLMATQLDLEREERRQIEAENDSLARSNFTLLEHNKLLVSRDTTLQEDLSTLITKCQADDWVRGVLEAELKGLRKGSAKQNGMPIIHKTFRLPLCLTLENQGPLRSQLVSLQDELHVAQSRLAVAEKERVELQSTILSLHRQMSLCVDSSTQALEVERELRADVSSRAISLQEENLTLRSSLDLMRSQGTWALYDICAGPSGKTSAGHRPPPCSIEQSQRHLAPPLLPRRESLDKRKQLSASHLYQQKNKWFVSTPSSDAPTPAIVKKLHAGAMSDTTTLDLSESSASIRVESSYPHMSTGSTATPTPRFFTFPCRGPGVVGYAPPTPSSSHSMAPSTGDRISMMWLSDFVKRCPLPFFPKTKTSPTLFPFDVGSSYFPEDNTIMGSRPWNSLHSNGSDIKRASAILTGIKLAQSFSSSDIVGCIV